MGFIIFIAFWIVAGIISAGTFHAYFKGKFPSVYIGREDLGTALVFGLLLGPIGMLVGFFMSGFMKNGWTLSTKPPKNTN